jgi:hypothetical protein
VAVTSLALVQPGAVVADASARTTAAPLLRFGPYGFPAYSPQIRDYAVRCAANAPARVDVRAPAATRVSVDGRAARSGAFTVTVPLAEGQALTVVTTTGRVRRSHTVRCLPLDFPLWTVSGTRPGSQQWYAIGLNTLGTPAPPYAVVFDHFGTPVWWYRAQASPIDVKFLGSTMVFSYPEPPYFFSQSPTARYELRRLDGTIVGNVHGAGSPIDSHELQQRGANYVYLSYRPRGPVDLSPWGGPADATVFDAVIEETAPDGSVVWSWNSKDHVALEESVRWMPQALATAARLPGGGVGYDIVHGNSVSVRGDSVLVSLRHTDAIYKIRRSTGDVVWKLGGTRTARSLTVHNDPFGQDPFGGQHDARLLADGTVTVYDNEIVQGRNGRAVRYRINESRRTATLVEEVTSPIPFASFCCGSARRLAGGSWLVQWGGIPFFGEYDRYGSLTFGVALTPSYRVDGVPAGRVSRAALVAGMNAMHPR